MGTRRCSEANENGLSLPFIRLERLPCRYDDPAFADNIFSLRDVMNPLFDGGGDDTTDTGYLLVNDAADADDQVPEQAADASLDDAAALQAGAGDTPARATVEEAPMSDLEHWKVSDLGCDVVVDEFEDVGVIIRRIRSRVVSLIITI